MRQNNDEKPLNKRRRLNIPNTKIKANISQNRPSKESLKKKDESFVFI